MELAKVAMLDTAQVVLCVVQDNDSNDAIEAEVADQFGVSAENTAVQSRVSANFIIHELNLNPGEMYVDG